MNKSVKKWWIYWLLSFSIYHMLPLILPLSSSVHVTEPMYPQLPLILYNFLCLSLALPIAAKELPL
ncbi:MAG TPA: hypothetical protein VN704_08080 [Verrucomicrobiae bacterium]|nr:hypothetical protein [Verrucomicrobiae bacterium]